MRAVASRVSSASVSVDGSVVGKINDGLLVYLGVGPKDDRQSAEHLAQRVISLRIFGDASGRMNLALPDVDGELLVVSQFTLYADTSHGHRPAFTGAAHPSLGEPLYEHFVEHCRHQGLRVAAGVFGARMEVDSVAQGPVTIVLSSPAEPWNTSAG